MAGRIPQAFLDDLLDRVDIVDVVDRRVKLRKTGKNYSACCPFHEEKTPSFTVNPDKQFYYCFGCGAGGNALGFVMDYENVEFPQAVETLATSVGLEVPREEGPAARARAEKEDGKKSLYKLMEQVADFYKQQLRSHPQAAQAVNYLKDRGLTGVIARDFGIGFAPPGWQNLRETLGDSQAHNQQLMQTGMLVENDKGNVYDRFRNRIMFPIRDQRGRVIAFGGRVLGDDKPKYLNSPETEIFHKGRELYGFYEALQANRKLDRLLVVEGYMDVIALAQYGINYATATLGTATSKAHLERVYRRCPEVIFCFDGDEAGRKAAFRALEAALPCMEDGRQARFLFLPEGEDPDTMVRANGKEQFETLLSQAMPLETFLFEAVAEGLDTSTLDGRARMSKLALPYLRQLPEGVYRQLMFQALAERTGLELESLMKLEVSAPEPPPLASQGPSQGTDGQATRHANQAQGWPANEAGPGPDDDAPPPELADYPDYDPEAGDEHQPRQRPAMQLPAGYSNLAQGAIALVLHKPEIARGVDPGSLAELGDSDGALLRQLLELVHRRPESNTGMLLGHWYGTTEGELLNRLAGLERLIPTEGIEQQFLDTIDKLAHQLPHHSKLTAQVDKLRSTNYADLSELEKQRLRELLQEKQQRDAQRK
ncbi:DNA primase [Halioglobus japonicus]|uniref:DNA primase n=1 Tax=Halioglobus japonicus TaxID=930805 RepID=A0AAP8SLW6_9GAMM|nr:DNA primase [Halioglobus japonicus]AQA17052.1 DNA primase [Halioglobus japonicus]PLW84960.1 DNA primase [Halioglobus japonicus]GHD18739.1 DNA primase [Halioglobus japonicus]